MIALLWSLLGFAVVYQLVTLVLVYRFRTREVEPRAELLHAPSLSHLKPISGRGPRTEECLRSYVDAPYPGTSQVVFSVGRPGDSVAEVARTVCQGHPERQVIEGDASGNGANPKVASMIMAYPHCRHAIILCTDCDMVAPPGYLEKMLSPFRDPSVGMVTSLYIVQRVQGPAETLEALSVLDFATSVLVARALEGMSFGLGANMAFRREALEQVGAFHGVGNYLAEDYQLGNRIHRKGWRVVLAGTIVESVLHPMKLSEYFSHQLRWMRTYRISRPAGHVAFIVTQGTLWALLLLLTTGFAPQAVTAALGWLLVRRQVVRTCWSWLGGRHIGGPSFLVALKDLCYLGLWALSLVGNQVRWGRLQLRLHPNGTMTVLRRLDP